MMTDTAEIEPATEAGTENGPGVDDLTDWMIKPVRTMRVRPLTYGLVVVFIAVAGLWAGATIEKHHGPATAGRATATSATSRTDASGTAASGQAGAGSTGPGGTGTTAGAATIGTVTAVSGDTITVKTSAGQSIHVVVTSTTLVSRTGEGAVGTIKTGDRLTAIGTTHGATVTATSVTATAAGVTQSSGFGPGGGFGGGTSGGTGAGAPAA